VLRAVNLVVEVFIDVRRDGGGYAEALLLHNDDRCLLARGVACVSAASGDVHLPDDLAVAALALQNLVDALTRTDPRPATDRCPPPRARSAVA
jgi:hypothetical protein